MGGLRTAALSASKPGTRESRMRVHRNDPWGSMDPQRWGAVTPLCPWRGWGDRDDSSALTWPGLILPLGDAAGHPLLVVLLLLGSDPLHPAKHRMLWNAHPQTRPGGTPILLTITPQWLQDPPNPTHCRFSWARDFFSASRWDCMLFRVLALNSAMPLRDGHSLRVMGGTPVPWHPHRDPSPTWKPAGQRPGGPA